MSLGEAEETRPIRLVPLGGLGEFGLNALVLEWEDELLLIDAGMLFPPADLPGVDFIVPDFDYLAQRRDKLRAILLTHGHEDHIGAVSFLLKEHDIPGAYFGEGIAIDGGRIVQLTWQSHKGFVYDRNTFKLIKTFDYPTEGWGITYDGRDFIMSDGSATLYFLDPGSFGEVGRLEAYDDKGPVTRLNELEYVKGEVFANVWGSDRIARIDPKTGRVTGWIDSRCVSQNAPTAAVRSVISMWS